MTTTPQDNYRPNILIDAGSPPLLEPLDDDERNVFAGARETARIAAIEVETAPALLVLGDDRLEIFTSDPDTGDNLRYECLLHGSPRAVRPALELLAMHIMRVYKDTDPLGLKAKDYGLSVGQIEQLGFEEMGG